MAQSWGLLLGPQVRGLVLVPHGSLLEADRGELLGEHLHVLLQGLQLLGHLHTASQHIRKNKDAQCIMVPLPVSHMCGIGAWRAVSSWGTCT